MCGIIKNEFRGPSSGFVSLGFVVVIPLGLFVLIASWFMAYRHIQMKNDRMVCRQSLTQAQQKAGAKIETLLSLNAQSRRLRLEMQTAKLALSAALASGNAAASAAAKIWIRRIKLERQGMILLQKRLIWSGKLSLQRAVFDIQNHLLQSSSASGDIKILNRDLALSPIRLAVRRINPTDPYPEYELHPRFSWFQRVDLKWQTQFKPQKQGLKPWLRFDSKWKNTCGVTLQRTENKFKVIPSEVRFL